MYYDCTYLFKKKIATFFQKIVNFCEELNKCGERIELRRKIKYHFIFKKKRKYESTYIALNWTHIIKDLKKKIIQTRSMNRILHHEFTDHILYLS